MSKDPRKILKDFEGKKPKKSDKKTFFEKMADFISLRYLKIMWHLIWNLDCAAKIFTVWEITIITAAVVYVISPLDAVPDFIPGVGLLDDAAVMTWILSMLSDELDKYEQMCM